MRIGILTFWWSNDNYGQALQCYALQKYLRDRGHEAFVIRYNWTSDVRGTPFAVKLLKAFSPAELSHCLRSKLRAFAVRREQSRHGRRFDDFRALHVVLSEKSYRSYTDLRGNPPEADAYIVGSDQVWNWWFENPRRFSNPCRAYFLDFGDEKTRRLSYAASWGVGDVPEEYRKRVAPMLSRFDYVSVREESGLPLCRSCGREDAEWVCDPALLLKAGAYRSICQKPQVCLRGEAFVLLYMLSDTGAFDIRRVYDWAEKKGLPVVYVTGNGRLDRRKRLFPSVPEWLWLLDNAGYVVTDSFHGALFSAMFGRQFGVVPRGGKHEGMNTRLDSLFAMLGTGVRYVSETDFSVLDMPYQVKPVPEPKRFLAMLEQ